MIQVDCEHCFKPFEVADSLAGGLATCSDCGKATPVPGLRDGWFRLTQIAMVVGWALVTAFAFNGGGLTAALLVGGATAAVFVIVYISM